MERNYFTERFDFTPFGDPFERKREVMKRRKASVPAQPNMPDVPQGSYLQSCQGCVLEAGGRRLRCTHCSEPGGGRIESSIVIADCGDNEQIGNILGALSCEPAAQPHVPLGVSHQGPEPLTILLPAGSYRDSCSNCELEDESRLLRCRCLSTQGQRVESTLLVDACGQSQHIGNHGGILSCETLPEPAPVPTLSLDATPPHTGAHTESPVPPPSQPNHADL